MVYQWINNNLSHWLPQACVLCGQNCRRHALCTSCLADLPQIDAATCHQCGLPLDGPASGPCGHCLQQSPGYDHVISGFAYAQPVAQLVAKLKFRGQIQLARLFGELLIRPVQAGNSQAQAILPVPLHPGRLRQRGFNQALEIARPLSRALHLPLLTDMVYRHRDTQPQSEQSAARREGNIRDAFSLNQPPVFQHVAIVDDVMTSGHTVNEIAKLLRAAGVTQIEVWCVARAWSHHTQLVVNRHERSQGKA